MLGATTYEIMQVREYTGGIVQNCKAAFDMVLCIDTLLLLDMHVLVRQHTYRKLLDIGGNHRALATPAGHEVYHNRLLRGQQCIVVLLAIDDRQLSGILHGCVSASVAEVLQGLLCIWSDALRSWLPVGWTHLQHHIPSGPLSTLCIAFCPSEDAQLLQISTWQLESLRIALHKVMQNNK